jgi:hypothetical protein
MLTMHRFIGKMSMYKILKDAAPDFHDLDNLGDPDKDVAISCSSRFVARLYEQNLRPALTLLTRSSLVFVICL